jgi:hypothetical protein
MKKVYRLKGLSLNERARALKIATDMPSINRATRRDSLKKAIKETLNAIKHPNKKKAIRKAA